MATVLDKLTGNELKEQNTFTVTVWGSANDTVAEKYLKEAFLVGLQIAKADKEAALSGKLVEFCNGGTGHGCMKWSAVGYLVGGGRRLYAINTKEISVQEESGVVSDYLMNLQKNPERKNIYEPLCIIHDMEKTLPRTDIERILKWEAEDRKQYLPDEIHFDLMAEEDAENLQPEKTEWQIGEYDLIIWPEIQVRMLEMIHRADILLSLAGGMGTKMEKNRAIMDIVFDGTLTEGLRLSFGGMGHWSPFTKYLKEEFPVLHEHYFNGRGKNSRLTVFNTPEEFADLLKQSITTKNFEQEKPSFMEYLQSRAGSEISLRMTTDSTAHSTCFYTGLFHGQNFAKDPEGIKELVNRGYRIMKLPKIRNSADFPNEFALYVKEAIAHVTNSENSLIILSLDPIGSDLKKIERRRMLQDYAHDSVFVGQQVNEPKGFQRVPVYVILPPEQDIGYLYNHDIISVLRHVSNPPHTKHNMTVIEKLMRDNAFIRQAEGVVYRPVGSVREALNHYESMMLARKQAGNLPDLHTQALKLKPPVRDR